MSVSRNVTVPAGKTKASVAISPVPITNGRRRATVQCSARWPVGTAVLSAAKRPASRQAFDGSEGAEINASRRTPVEQRARRGLFTGTHLLEPGEEREAIDQAQRHGDARVEEKLLGIEDHAMRRHRVYVAPDQLLAPGRSHLALEALAHEVADIKCAVHDARDRRVDHRVLALTVEEEFVGLPNTIAQ